MNPEDIIVSIIVKPGLGDRCCLIVHVESQKVSKLTEAENIMIIRARFGKEVKHALIFYKV